VILPAQELRDLQPVSPFYRDRQVRRGMTFGCSAAGYDIRIAQSLILWPGRFVLASSVEWFGIPDWALAIIHDKSTHIRRGLVVGNTVAEPGWSGYLTLELKNQSQWRWIRLRAFDPIAQVVFHKLTAPTDTPYAGKYQFQANCPVPAILETA
jgi:dCTP deaminase